MDASKEMTEIASKRLASQPIIRGDFLEIPLRSESFDSAICMYWSIAGLDHDQVRKLFLEVSRVLKPKAILIFDVENAEGIKENLLNEPFIDAFFQDQETDSNIIRANLSRKVAPDLVDWHAYYLIERKGVSELRNDCMRLRFYSRSTLEKLLGESRFHILEVSSSPGEQYLSGSPSLYLVAQKGK